MVLMRLLRGLYNPGLKDICHQGRCVATIGNFDGVHLGHQAIIQQVISEAKKRDLPSLVVVFEPQPMEFFKGDQAPARLMRFREKCQALSAFDIDYIFCLKFDAKLSQLSALAFIHKVLIEHLNIDHLVIGDDFRFGGDRLGDFSLLLEVGRQYGFSVENTPTVLENLEKHNLEKNSRVSSTYIRSLLSMGEFSRAEMVLGQPYGMIGRVIHGQKLGRQLGFPTANVALKRVKAPFIGVYAVRVFRHDDPRKQIQGVANIGVKPSVGHFKPLLEIHLLDFDENLYGEKIRVNFCKKIRDEKKFEGLDELVLQIKQDVLDTRAFFAES